MMTQTISRRCAPLPLVLLTLLLAACGREPTLPPPDQYQTTTIQDLREFPQDLRAYAAKAGGDRPLLTPEQSAAEAERFRKLFFAAWAVTKPDKGNLDFFRAELQRQGAKRGYAENLQPWDAQRWDAMAANADWASFPSLRAEAITVRASNLRTAPTMRPRFVHPSAPGQGFPFDEFQQTSLPVGFPLMVLHRSADSAWLYVESAFVPGWILAQDVAFVDDAFQNQWKAAPLAAAVEDNVPLRAPGGSLLAVAHIGAVLPREGSDVLVPARAASGSAQIVRVRAQGFAPLPLPLTANRMADIGNQLLGQPYGWGGLFENRDCSAMMRDMFTPFGLWLPRNSASQAKACVYVDIAGKSPAAKEAAILADGVPFRTLLWLPGHIGLYVGEYNGKAAFFHNIWGIRTKGEGAWSGRHVLGRAVVTSTRPGRELPDLGQGALLLDRMQGMSLLGMPCSASTL